MAANGISTLSTKELRQVAKLELAQTKRQLTGTQGYRENRYYDLDLLPTKYSGDGIVNNPNLGGLQPGRPWKTTPNVLSGLWRSQYNGYFEADWTWFDTQTPIASIQVNDFTFPDGGDSYQWLGYFKAPHTANYTFYLESDDRAQFWLGAKAITGYDDGNWDVYSDAGEGESSTDPIALVAGQYYPIRLQYGDTGGDNFVDFSWSDDYTPPAPTGVVIQLSDLATATASFGATTVNSDNIVTTGGWDYVGFDNNSTLYDSIVALLGGTSGILYATWSSGSTSSNSYVFIQSPASNDGGPSSFQFTPQLDNGGSSPLAGTWYFPVTISAQPN